MGHLVEQRRKGLQLNFMINAINSVLNSCINSKFVLSLFVLHFFNCSILAQGPWIREVNKSYWQLGVSALSYDRVRYDNAVIQTNRTNYDITNQLYVEYGLYEKIDVTLILPYNFMGYKSKTGASDNSINGFGNITIGSKYNLINKKTKVSVGALISMPAFKSDDVYGLRTGFESTTVKPFITLGGSSKRFYYYINSSYGLMTNNYSDYLEVSGEFGYNVKKRIHLIVNGSIREPITNELFYSRDQPSYSFTGNYLDQQKYVVYGIKINYEFVENKYGLNTGIISGLNGALGATNIPVSRSYNFAIYRKF